MENIKSAWLRIMAWYGANTPEATLILASGAPEAEIIHFEEQVGFRLPDDLRASFALHNGTTNEGFLLHFGELLSLEQILLLRNQYLDWQTNENWGLGKGYETRYIEGPIQPVWWKPTRLALTDNSGDAAMIDFEPASGGQAGQIIEFDHEVGPRRVLANSFGEWLQQLADGLEKGEYVYYEDELTVGPPGMW